MDFIVDFMQAIDQLKAKNVVGIGTILMVLVRVYRMVPKAPWPSAEKSWIVFVVLAAVGFLTALFTGVFAFGLSWPVAISAAVGIAVNAMGLHEATKAIGNLQTPKPAGYQPSAFRKAATVLIPAPKIDFGFDVGETKKDAR